MATANPLPLEPAPARALERVTLRISGDDVSCEPGWRGLSPEECAELEQVAADIAAGRQKTVPHSEVQEMMAERRRRQQDCDACAGEGEVEDHECASCQGSGGFCKTCSKPWRACVETNACEPPGAPWAERRRRGE
jgi:hypothetical protein